MRNILLTGSTGFIGTSLKKKIEKKNLFYLEKFNSNSNKKFHYQIEINL